MAIKQGNIRRYVVKHGLRRFMLNAVAVAACCALIVLLSLRLGPRAASFETLSGRMEAEVYYAGGGAARFEDGDFGLLKKGDRAEIQIELPATLPGGAPELFVPLYNAIVNVDLDGAPLYRDTYDPGDVAAHYGNRVYQIPLPEGGAGGKLTLEITATQRLPFSDLGRIGLVSANEGWKRIIGGNTLLFVIFLTILCVSSACALYCLVRSVNQRRMQPALPIALFELAVLTWFAGSQRVFFLLFEDAEICAKLEYYALYFIPLPLAHFIYLAIDRPAYKRAIRVAGLAYLAYYVVTLAIEQSRAQINYSDMTVTMHPLGALVILLLVVALFRGADRGDRRHVYILRYGALVSMISGICELVRFNIAKYTALAGLFTVNGVSVFSLMIIASFTIAIVDYVVSTAAEEYTLRIERRQLMTLAYRDSLTGMPNRAECYRQIDRMEAEHRREYAMVFIDLNNLKLANDVHGHEVGDSLLKTVADATVEAFSDGGFCARWGGDEFVACVFGPEAEAEKRVERFQRAMARADAAGKFPFKVSAAVGCVASTPERYIAPLEAIRRADALMYENKKRMKCGRGD